MYGIEVASKRKRLIGRLMLLVAIICGLTGFSQAAQIPTELQPQTASQGFLRPGAIGSYLVKLDAGNLAEVVLEQGGTDLMATIIPPAGTNVVVDSREGGPEPILIYAPIAGIYRLEISTVQKRLTRVSYRLMLRTVRNKKDDDGLRLQAQQMTTEAKQLGSQRSPQEIRRAIDLDGKALEAWHQLGDRRAEASVLVELGAWHFALSQYEEAKSNFRKAIPLAQAESERWTEGEGVHNLGTVLWESGDFAEAIQRLEQALTIWKELGNRYGEAAAVSNLGILYRETGSYRQAVKHYRQALPIVIGLGDQGHTAYVWSNLGVALHALAEGPQSLDAFEHAAALFRASNNPRGEGRNMLHIAEIHMAAHRYSVARDYVERALPLVERTEDYRSAADGWELLGDILTVSHKDKEALRHYDKALATYQRVSNRAGEANALHSIGVLYGKEEKNDLAITYLNHAAVLRHDLGIRDGEAETLYQLAKVETGTGKLTEARAHIDAALYLAESVRALVTGPQLRMSYLASKHQYYALACDIYLRLEQENPGHDFDRRGLEVAERGRARSLLDTVDEAQIRIGQASSPDVVAKEHRLHEEINFLSTKATELGAKGDRQKQESATHRLDVALGEYYELESEIRDSDPGYGRLAPRPLSVTEIQGQLLDANTVLLEYALGPEHSSLWVVTSDSLTLYPLSGRSTIEHQVQLFFESLRISGRASGNGKIGAPPGGSPEKVATALGRMLLPRDAALGTKRLLIVGDGVLQRLPFGALPERTPDVRLIQKHEIVFLPSASVLAAERREIVSKKPTRKTLAVIADPVFDAGDTRNDKPLSGIKPAFGRLPYTRHEAEAILDLLPAEKALRALDFAADRQLFLSGTLAKYRMLHIATHAVVDVARPELSALILSMVDKKGLPREGYLRMHQIAALRLPASLVTLSACGTGLGKEVGGEGTVGLARGFLDGGAATVVVSLWDVEDESTAELMKVFYEGMLGNRHLHPAAALREAQLAMLNNSRWTPYNWSGWLVIGDWR